MRHEEHGGDQNQLEEHSLPGTNQAGKGPASAPTTPAKGPADVEKERAAKEKRTQETLHGQ